jgi:saccharopine dehydrogenase (NADP+, L-glutamate forming)
MAKSILILGAGRSSSSLISYLLSKKSKLDLSITIGDKFLSAAKEKAGGEGSAIAFDIENLEDSKAVIEKHDIVVSLLPASLHAKVALLCVQEKKHLLTASYVSDQMRALDSEARQLGLLFLNECGLDPGLDHMTAMEMIDQIKEKGGEIRSFESFTGGLIAPSTDPANPWRYKFTWNPRNVVLAGQGTAKFLQNGYQKYIPYHQLFKRTTPIFIPQVGEFEGYANRDSLGYMETYGLHAVKTMIRGTLRNKGYCSSWDIFVQLGCTDDSYIINLDEKASHQNFLELFLPDDPLISVESKIASQFFLEPDSHEMMCLRWLGFFSNEVIGKENGSPAQILEHILDKKWKLLPQDIDQVIMWHRFTYLHENRVMEMNASLCTLGDDAVNTAMAKTVGLPLAIATQLLVQLQISETGVVIPTRKKIYQPILKALKPLGIELKHY